MARKQRKGLKLEGDASRTCDVGHTRQHGNIAYDDGM